MNRIFFALFAVLAAALLLTACDTGTEADDEPEAGLDTVEGAILLLEQCWEEADIDTYPTLFTDYFTFYFDPGDVGGDIPASWGLEDELEAAEAMFEYAGADNIRLTLTLPEDFSEPEGDSAWVYGAEYDIRIKLDDTTYHSSGTAVFNLYNSNEEWRIRLWYDFGGYLAEMTSWGQIKYLYQYH